MAATKKKIEVEVEVSETPVESAEIPTPTEAAVEVKENDKPVLVAETEPSPPPTSQIFGPVAPEPPASNKKLFWILIIVFTLLGAVAGGVGIYLQNQGGSKPDVVATPTLTPTPTPKVELNREDLSIQVLNGSGVTGAAAAARDLLEELGYSVVAVGNADSANFTTTQIAIKNSQEAYLHQLKQDLGDEYTLADEIKTLDEDFDSDAVVTLGRQ